MKVAIVGAGAMGSIFGARFTNAGVETTLIDVSAPLVDHIQKNGITIRDGESGKETVTNVKATVDPSEVGPVDIVVFFVKCYHTRAAAEAVRELVDQNTVVVSFQNGWGNGETLSGLFAPEQIVLGVTYNSGTILGQGRVLHPGVRATVIGSYSGGDSAGVEQVRDVLSVSGLDAEVGDRISEEIWKKLILNAATLPTSALTGLNAEALTGQPDMHELVSRVAREAVKVARALDFDISEEERVNAIHTLLENAGTIKASMLQDFEAGRRTEIDVINGAVVKAAAEKELDVPLNATLLSLVKGWETANGLV